MYCIYKGRRGKKIKNRNYFIKIGDYGRKVGVTVRKQLDIQSSPH